MSDGVRIEGLDELRRALASLPDTVQKRVSRSWALDWSRTAYAAAVNAAPVGKTRNLITGIARRDSTPATLRNLQSLARSVVIGKKPAFHFHLVVAGTAPRWTGATSRKGKRQNLLLTRALRGVPKKRAFRGIMPANDFMGRAAAPLQQPATADLARRVQRELDRIARRARI